MNLLIRLTFLIRQFERRSFLIHQLERMTSVHPSARTNDFSDRPPARTNDFSHRPPPRTHVFLSIRQLVRMIF